MFETKDKQLNTTALVDEIEKAVYTEMKPYGFRKHGRTLHRFVDGDISQVINFQNGCAAKGIFDVLWVNVGIRVPECMLRCFIQTENTKKYYHEYECNMRSRLGEVEGKDESYYDLHDPIEKITADIIRQLKNYVIPTFEVLNSRSSILENRKDYPNFDKLNAHMILLEEAMIWGRLDNLPKAHAIFNKYYYMVSNKMLPQKDPVAIKNHLNYLDKLAIQLNIPVETERNY